MADRNHQIIEFISNQMALAISEYFKHKLKSNIESALFERINFIEDH